MTDKDTSTLQSYIDKASGLAQEALGSITGNSADKSQAEQKKATADARDQLSHAGTTVGGVSIGPGGVAANDPNRTQGSWDQTLGSAKETVGNLFGIESLKKEGREQNAQGQATEAKGQLNDLGGGIKDRATGAIGGGIASLTGNEAAKADYQAQHDHGKTLQRGVESELDKKADA